MGSELSQKIMTLKCFVGAYGINGKEQHLEMKSVMASRRSSDEGLNIFDLFVESF